MPLYPDLAACRISFIHFACHLGGGIADVDAFWQERGAESAKRLLFASYSRLGRSHTVWLQWARTHEDCCDLFIGLEARRPSEVWPKLPLANHRLRENHFREFLETIAKSDRLGRVKARYGFPWDKNLDSLFPLPPVARPVSLTLEVMDEAEKLAMTVTYEKAGDSWLAIVAPTGSFMIKDEPVTDTFFSAPYATACLLATSFSRSPEAL